MSSTRSFLPALFVLATLFCGLLSPASAQVIVYKVRFEPVRSVNLDFYNEGYFVAPATGGAGSFIFTVNTNREKLYSPTSPGRLFVAKTKDNTIRWIVSASSGATSGSTSASYVCFGSALDTARFRGPLFDIRSKIAPHLRGGVTAYADESGTTTPAEDETISFAAVMDMRMSYDKDRTSNANKDGKTVALTITDLIAELERRGYDPEVTAAPTPTPLAVP